MVGPTVNPYGAKRKRTPEEIAAERAQQGMEFQAGSQMSAQRNARQMAQESSQSAAERARMGYASQERVAALSAGYEPPGDASPQQDRQAQIRANMERDATNRRAWAAKEQARIQQRIQTGRTMPSATFRGSADDESQTVQMDQGGNVQATGEMMRQGEMGAQRSRAADLSQSVGSQIRGYDRMAAALRNPMQTQAAREGSPVSTGSENSLQANRDNWQNRPQDVMQYQQAIEMRDQREGGPARERMASDQAELARLEMANSANELISGNAPIGEQALMGRMNPEQLAQYGAGQLGRQPVVTPSYRPMPQPAPQQVAQPDPMQGFDRQFFADNRRMMAENEQALAQPIPQIGVLRQQQPLQAPVPQMFPTAPMPTQTLQEQAAGRMEQQLVPLQDRAAAQMERQLVPLQDRAAAQMPAPQPQQQEPVSPGLSFFQDPMAAFRRQYADMPQRAIPQPVPEPAPTAPQPQQIDRPALAARFGEMSAASQQEADAGQKRLAAMQQSQPGQGLRKIPGGPADRADRQLALNELTAEAAMANQPGQPTATEASPGQVGLASSMAKGVTPMHQSKNRFWWSPNEPWNLDIANMDRWERTRKSLWSKLDQITNPQQLSIFESDLENTGWLGGEPESVKNAVRNAIAAKRISLQGKAAPAKR